MNPIMGPNKNAVTTVAGAPEALARVSVRETSDILDLQPTVAALGAPASPLQPTLPTAPSKAPPAKHTAPPALRSDPSKASSPKENPWAKYKTKGLEFRPDDRHPALEKPVLTEAHRGLIQLEPWRGEMPVQGSRMLLVVPSKNTFKVDTLNARLAAGYGLDPKTEIEVLVVPHESGVGNQPYGLERALKGATNRINNTVAVLGDGEQFTALTGGAHTTFASFCAAKGIGDIRIGSIENIFVDKGSDGQLLQKGYDVGATMLYDPCAHPSATAFDANFSRRVLVDRRYIDRAKRAGLSQGKTENEVEVGQIIAGNVEGATSDDWHKVFCGESRYDLLREACDGLRLPPRRTKPG
ncbi:MAG TPA: hypothetical protein VFH51_15115 [Myxococcota bacterium]|nr:hypothetical protein [Myxococcota bacterium]